MNFSSVIQSCKVKLCSNIFEAADNSFDDVNSDHWDQYPITIVTWYCWKLWHRLFVCQWSVPHRLYNTGRVTSGMCTDQSILPQGPPVERITSLLHGGHVRLGVNFMSWSNFCVLVWLSLPWRNFITLSDNIWICGHVMYDVILYGCHVNLGMIFFSYLDEIFVLVGFSLSWFHFTPWCNQPNLGMIILRFGYNFRVSEILFPLVSLVILMWLTASWYDFPSFC